METEYSIEFCYKNNIYCFITKSYNKDLFKKKDTISKPDAMTVLNLIQSYMDDKMKFLPHDIVVRDAENEILFTIEDLKEYL